MRPETKALYPANWKEISRATIEARGGKCEDCGRTKRDPYVVLTTHHVDYNPANNHPTNLAVLCQGCHLRRQARDLANATRFGKVELLMRMGQLCFPGMEPKRAKHLTRVIEGKALTTAATDTQYAHRDTWQSHE